MNLNRSQTPVYVYRMIKKRNVKFVFLSSLIVYILIFSDIGIISKIKLDKKIRNYENKITQMQSENEVLKMQIEKLNDDYDYIAELARKLGYARPGEKIYRFSPVEPETNIKRETNKTTPPRDKFNIKDYLIYFITFLVIIIIYINQ